MIKAVYGCTCFRITAGLLVYIFFKEIFYGMLCTREKLLFKLDIYNLNMKQNAVFNEE